MNKSEQEQGIRENIEAQLKTLEEDRKKIRFQHSLGRFITGELTILESEEFAQGLTSCFEKEKYPNADVVNDIIEAMMGTVFISDASIRQRLLPVLYQAATFFLSLDNSKGINCILAIMLEWLSNETETLAGAESVTKKIEECTQWLLKDDQLPEVEEALTRLHRIQAGDVICNAALRAMAAKCLKGFTGTENLGRMTDGYLMSQTQKELFQKILIALSPDSVFYILDQAVQCEIKSERLELIKLISNFGNYGVSALVSCLKSKPSWAVVRNIIYIFGAIGDPENYSNIEGYHGFPDERVQLETISTTIKLGGEEKRSRLIRALIKVNERLKLYILRYILEEKSKDEELFDSLKNLVAQRATFSYSVGTELLSSIISALKLFPKQEAVDLLMEMREDYVKGVGGGQVVLLIDEALGIIKPKIRHGVKNLTGDDDYDVVFENDPALKQIASNAMRSIESNIQKFVRVGDNRGASAYIYEQAITATHQGNFTVAEKLRDRLLEVNPLALSEVVKIGEMIDGQRSVSITPHHIEIWQELYDRMTTKQFNALYYNCFQENYSKGDIIVNRGETDSCLYFLNSGTISLCCDSAGNEIFLRKVNPGDILGAEQFFSASVWTVTIKALSAVQVNVLDQENWKKVLKEAPELEEKLAIFCQRYEKIADLVKMTGDDRRTDSRYPKNLKTRHILLDPFGQKSKRSFRGELIDLSRSGIAFTIKLANQRTARSLLGRQILSYLEMKGAVYPEFVGLVVGVKQYESLKQKYSVHVKLAKTIDEAHLKSILRSY